MAWPWWPAMPGLRGTQLGGQGASPTLPERATTLAKTRDSRSPRLDGGAPWPQHGHGGRVRSGHPGLGAGAILPLLRSITRPCPPKPPRTDPKGREEAAHRSQSVAALGTETEHQNPVRVEARMAWEVTGWVVDGVTQLWV
jgi:hypothetical protein